MFEEPEWAEAAPVAAGLGPVISRPPPAASSQNKVPLEDESVDVAVFCLSLMGTNIRDFLEEANRVLKPGGLLKVAEVSSRFEDVRTFLRAVTKLGFKIVSKDLSNSHFFLFDFQKTGPPLVGPKAQLSGLQLQPCLYKRR
ncbi:RRP8 isoform 4 [Pan troglodytes]|uniref:Ribosomal RNA-processing protein 8 n=2 Tax=Pan troglodytes TaxID=9598 RepID=A0A6D2WZE2_PANTR|nr:RRP8 isoform 4 [Pan troglodytes]